MAASEHLYNAGNASDGAAAGDGQQQQQSTGANNDGGVADAEYEEVK